MHLPAAKFVAFSLTPLIVLTLTAEAVVRVRYYVQHDYDWHYLTTPFPLNARSIPLERQMPEQVRDALKAQRAAAQAPSPEPHAPPPAPAQAPPVFAMPPAPAPASTPPASAPPETPPAPAAPSPAVTPREATAQAPAPAVSSPRAAAAAAHSVPTQPAHAAAPAASPPPVDQMVFLWPSPCRSGGVYSTERQAVLPRTWDEHCFRGDRIALAKPAGEYRIAFLGGSTVQDFQSDDEMMTARFKQALTTPPGAGRPVVINAGRAGFNSQQILDDYRMRVSRFSIDLALYYEGWNEQPRDLKPARRADDVLSTFQNRFHAVLYHRSQLYTYLVEKSAFMKTSQARFWKIDTGALHATFTALANDARAHGTKLVFVTQAIRFPRTWKGVDTFDQSAVSALIDRLRAEPRYRYDVTEISALNQRLAVASTAALCRDLGIPVVNVLDEVEALGESGRAPLFMDLGHLTVQGDRVVGTAIARGLMATTR